MASIRTRSLPVGPACGYDRAVSDVPYDVASHQGDWLSRLERTVHIREVTGSNPVSPTKIASLVASTLTMRCEPRLSVLTTASLANVARRAVDDHCDLIGRAIPFRHLPVVDGGSFSLDVLRGRRQVLLFLGGPRPGIQRGERAGRGAAPPPAPRASLFRGGSTDRQLRRVTIRSWGVGPVAESEGCGRASGGDWSDRSTLGFA